MMKFVARLGKLWVSSIVLLALGMQSCQLKSDKAPAIDYAPLIKELEAKNWHSADSETLKLILKIGDRTTEGWLARADVEALDCEAILKIDRLWTKASEGQFDFNRQRLIWLSLGGTVGQYTPEMAEKFGDRVGWRSQGQWRAYNDLDFSLEAPKGHLPASTGNGVSGSIWGGVAAIGQRVQYCRRQGGISAARNEYYADCKKNSRERRCQLKEAAERWGDTPDWGGAGIQKLLDELEQALAVQQWSAADKITKTLLDRYRRANLAEFGDSDSPELIPCYLLEAVDDLWMEYSQGRFGLSAQAAVLSELKLLPLKRSHSSYQMVDSLHEALGWPKDRPSRFEEPYNPAFNAVEPDRIPRGYYPYDMGYSYYTYGSGYIRGWRFALDRACGFN